MTWYFRLLAGFTSFMSKRARSHFSSMGPAGILAFSSIASPSGACGIRRRVGRNGGGLDAGRVGRARRVGLDDAGEHGERDGGESGPDDDGDDGRAVPPQR